jgi:uncharacterized protein
MGHKATVQAIYEDFGRGDVESILARLADDVEWDRWPHGNSAQQRGVPYLVERSDRAGVGEFFEAAAGLEFHRFEPRALIEDGDHVVALIDIDVTVRATGRRFQDDEIHLWTFGPDGHVTGLRHYIDTAKHAEASVGAPVGA